VKKKVYDFITDTMVFTCCKTPILPIVITMLMLISVSTILMGIDTGSPYTSTASASWSKEDNILTVVVDNAVIMKHQPDQIVSFLGSDTNGVTCRLHQKMEKSIIYQGYCDQQRGSFLEKGGIVKVGFIVEEMTALERIINDYR
jgi:hypothetical protein